MIEKRKAQHVCRDGLSLPSQLECAIAKDEITVDDAFRLRGLWANTIAGLKGNVETLAKAEGLGYVETITLLQGAAAATNNDRLLDALCKLKWAELND
jgi:hypothetical protein